MRLVADLHVHSRYSRATSKEADLAGYERWARVKGIDIVGTGDFTHPRWIDELSSQLVEKDGLYVLKEPPAGSPLAGGSPAHRVVRFTPTTEISSIYKKHGRVRKVHSVIGVPTLEHARLLGARLARIGNIASDGRPILGLDPKDLLSLVLETSAEGFLIPAHIWTPWFSLFGSKSGFDAIEECFEELTPHIFALETGLSSDPRMNWRWSALDRFRLVSNSDAHSPPNLGREATLLDTDLSWHGVMGALRTGTGFLGTVEFFPEEGKYHFDGHRKCGVSMNPEQTRACGGICPVCGSPMTIGVLSRVLDLADRPTSVQPRAGEGFRSLIPLPELLAELVGSGAGSRAVQGLYATLISDFGNEYTLLLETPIQDIERARGPLLAEAIRRMREGKIDPQPGYDGEFGIIRVFDDLELDHFRGQDTLFPAPTRQRKSAAAGGPASSASPRQGHTRTAAEDPSALDPVQSSIVASTARRLLVHAGPGAGKTRLLVQWLSAAASRARDGSTAIALAFTNRAAREMEARLARLAPSHGARVLATTFHSLCWMLLRELDPHLTTIVTPTDRLAILRTLGLNAARGHVERVSESMERVWEGMETADEELRAVMAGYDGLLARMGGMDVSSLVHRLISVLRDDERARMLVESRFSVVAIDELQDINTPQFDLLDILCSKAESVLAIGDPDQAIYGFRGSDRDLFFRFQQECGATAFGLGTNYRSTATIVRAASEVITPGRSPGSPSLGAARPSGDRINVVAVEDPSAEGRFIASTILDLVGGVDSLSADAKRARKDGGRAFSDIAILYRTRAVRDALLPALTASGLPLATREAASLVTEEPVRSMVAALRLTANPEDILARAILDEHGRAELVLARAAEAAALATEGRISAALDIFARDLLPSEADPGTMLAIESLRAMAAESGADLKGFLARLSLCQREGEGPYTVEKVSLLTFHAAKGLEYPVVFIAGAEEGITPLPDDLEEERRLFYVALTRARDTLYVTHCARRAVHGQRVDSLPSRFLSAFPPDLLAEARPRPRARSVQLSLFSD